MEPKNPENLRIRLGRMQYMYSLPPFCISVPGAKELSEPEIVSTVCHCLEHFPDNLQLQQEIFAFLVPVLAISGTVCHVI